MCGCVWLVGKAVWKTPDDVAGAAEEQPPHTREEGEAVLGEMAQQVGTVAAAAQQQE
jgi:hypothetical protein